MRDLEVFLAQFADTSEETALRVAKANATYDDELTKFTDVIDAEAERVAATDASVAARNQAGYDQSNALRANDYLRRALAEGRYDDASLEAFNIESDRLRGIDRENLTEGEILALETAIELWRAGIDDQIQLQRDQEAARQASAGFALGRGQAGNRIADYTERGFFGSARNAANALLADELEYIATLGLEGNELALRLFQATESHTGLLESIENGEAKAALEAMRQRDRQISLAESASADLVRIRENTSDAFLAAAERLIGGSQLSETYQAQVDSLRLATDQGIVANPQLAAQYEASFRAAVQIVAQNFLGFGLVDAPDPTATTAAPRLQPLSLTIVIPPTLRSEQLELVEDIIFDLSNERTLRLPTNA